MPSKKTPPTRGQAKSSSPELDLIRTLADILNETGLSEIELEQKGSRVRVSRTMTAVATVAHARLRPIMRQHLLPLPLSPRLPMRNMRER